MATEPCDRFNRFVNSTDYKFAMVETKDDLKALRVTGLACKNLVKIRDHYRVWGSDTSILHHAFMTIFIALWAIIPRYVMILMAILSYFTRFI